jgi:pimeloyl-ACP methyl ester carboxylesterase
MSTFALVHGSWHGSWCWDLITPLLQQAGHDVVAPDLPIEDKAASFDTYADVVCSALDEYSDDVVLVAHSMGGQIAPLIATRRPVRHLVYLAALVPQIGLSLLEQMTEEPNMVNPAQLTGLTFDTEKETAARDDVDISRQLFFADCDDATATAAIERLRPQAGYPSMVRTSLTEHPKVRCSYIACTGDQMVSLEWARRIAKSLGADLTELPGGHSPFLSRPEVLTDVLLRIVDGN